MQNFLLLVGGAAAVAALNLGVSPHATHAARAAVQLSVSGSTSRPRNPVKYAEVETIVPNDSLEFTHVPAELKQAVARAPPELQRVVRRAEFWTNESATVLEILNVVGRWRQHSDFVYRSEFTLAEMREESLAQSATKNRYEMAQRMGCAERVALVQNCPKLPFTDEKLAASVGMTVEDFEAIPVTIAAANVVYDALAESRSGLIPFATVDQRRGEWVNDDGSLNMPRFMTGLAKSRFVVIIAWFWFGKGNFVWVLLSVQALHDFRPDLFPTPKDLNLDKVGFFI